MQTTLRVIDPKSAHFGERVTGIQPRETVYDVAARAGFPSSQVGLAGRLDYLTSGVMLMSNDSRMLNGVIRPPDERWEEGDGDGDGEGEEEEARRRKLFKYKTKVYEVRCFSSRLHELSDFVAIAAELSEPFVFSRQGQQHRTSRASVQVLRRWQAEEHSCGGRPELGWSVDLRVELKEGKHHQVRGRGVAALPNLCTSCDFVCMCWLMCAPLCYFDLSGLVVLPADPPHVCPQQVRGGVFAPRAGGQHPARGVGAAAGAVPLADPRGGARAGAGAGAGRAGHVSRRLRPLPRAETTRTSTSAAGQYMCMY